jgi:pimeloyl-ACP methyl ester carboxylesterase
MTTLLMIHGGLWEDMDAERFWHRPRIVAGLQRHGIEVLTPDRPRRASSWASEAEDLAAALPDHPVTVIAGSNGCSAAARLALIQPGRVERLLLAWPATAGASDVDTHTRRGLTELGASPDVIETLLSGQTLRGVTTTNWPPSPNRSACSPRSPRTRTTNGARSMLCSACCHTRSNCPAAPNHRARTSGRTPSRSSGRPSDSP